MTSINIETERAGTFPGSDLSELRRLLDQLGGRIGSYLIVTRPGESEAYAQTAIATEKAKAPGRFVVEHREGPHRHFQGFTDDIEAVFAVLSGWSVQSGAWRQQLKWAVLDLGF